MNGRRTPGNHGTDEEAEVVALSPNSLMNSNRYVCEVCNKGFQRDQNLQLHKRGHQLPWKLKRRSQMDNKKKVYLCPVPTCPHHHRSRALGDITGIKKHFFRKHCEKNYKCLKCIKCYAVKSDWTAHMKNCGSNSYKCDCGLVFGRKDTYRSHKAFCEALAAESLRVSASHPQLETSSEDDSAIETMNQFHGNNNNSMLIPSQGFTAMLQMPSPPRFPLINYQHQLTGTSSALPQIGNNFSTSNSDGFQLMNNSPGTYQLGIKEERNTMDVYHASMFAAEALPPKVEIERNNNYTMMSQATSMQNYLQQEPVSAMTLLQRVNVIGGSSGNMMGSTMNHLQMGRVGSTGVKSLPAGSDYYYLMGQKNRNEYPTRDFLGLSVGHGGGDVGGSSGINSTVMVDYSLGGTTNNMNLTGNWGGEGSEWVPTPRMTNADNANVHQTYGFAGGPSTSQGWNLHDGK